MIFPPALIKKVFLTIFLMFYIFSGIGQIYKEDKIVPFYLTVGYGKVSINSDKHLWEINYGVDINIPYIIRENQYDIQFGINIFDQPKGTFNRIDFGTSLHLAIGKRYEKKNYLLGGYLGPDFMIIDKRGIRKTELSLYASLPIFFKPIVELGLGIVPFTVISRNESVFGLRFCLLLRNIPK